ncbi:uncharacterized protein G2W53_004506 [Senna tora]|uniref:MULE transposase domain-containing protein n=1 Tax=Senna tora TaxID=362788 RepID=A0A834XD13_9FABA|nr:uncharacterized protein G2W53_004506 [Senna tora]
MMELERPGEEKKKRQEAKAVATSASIGIFVALESHAQQEELSLSLSLISSEVKAFEEDDVNEDGLEMAQEMLNMPTGEPNDELLDDGEFDALTRNDIEDPLNGVEYEDKDFDDNNDGDADGMAHEGRHGIQPIRYFVPTEAQSQYLKKGLVFPDKKSLGEAVKIFSFKRHLNYSVTRSGGKSYEATRVKHDNGCPWRVRACLKANLGMWLITKYDGDHSCATPSMSQDHRKQKALAMHRPIPNNDSDMQFLRLFWAFKPCIDAWAHLKPWIQLDDTFLYGKYHHTLLIAMGQDGNSNIVPLAFAIVEGETQEAWAWSIRCLAIVEDEAVGWQPELGHHVYCICHVVSNFNIKFRSNPLKKLLKDAAHVFQAHVVDKTMRAIYELNDKAGRRLDQIPCEKWCRTYDEGRRYRHLATNLANCMNNVLKGVWSMPIMALVQSTFCICMRDKITKPAGDGVWHARTVQSTHVIVVSFSPYGFRLSMCSRYHFHPIAGEEYWPEVPGQRLRPNPVALRPPGRPRSTRIHNEMDWKQKGEKPKGNPAEKTMKSEIAMNVVETSSLLHCPIDTAWVQCDPLVQRGSVGSCNPRASLVQFLVEAVQGTNDTKRVASSGGQTSSMFDPLPQTIVPDSCIVPKVDVQDNMDVKRHKNALSETIFTLDHIALSRFLTGISTVGCDPTVGIPVRNLDCGSTLPCSAGQGFLNNYNDIVYEWYADSGLTDAEDTYNEVMVDSHYGYDFAMNGMSLGQRDFTQVGKPRCSRQPTLHLLQHSGICHYLSTVAGSALLYFYASQQDKVTFTV